MTALPQALLKRTLQEVPDCSGVDPPQTFGVLHEALRPLAHRYLYLSSVLCFCFGMTGTLECRKTMTVPIKYHWTIPYNVISLQALVVLRQDV